MNPKAREDVLLTDLEDELVIYDPTNFNGHNLNKTSKLVFEHCDGQHSVRDLAKMLELELDVEDGTDYVSLALKQINKKGLLEAGSLPEAPTITRREVMKLAKMAGLAIAVLPVIQTIVVPAPAAAQSGEPCASGSCLGTRTCTHTSTTVSSILSSIGYTCPPTGPLNIFVNITEVNGKSTCSQSPTQTYIFEHSLCNQLTDTLEDLIGFEGCACVSSFNEF